MIAFIDDHRSVHGVGPICRVLGIAPSTYYGFKSVERDPELASDRARQDRLDMVAIKEAFNGSRGRYGARKVWHQLRRSGHDIARCTVERLMKAMELQGVVRGKKVITTNPDAAQPCPDDKVNRAFVSAMPNQLWVSDFTYVSSWQGMVYVAFVIDVFARRIVGWRVSTSMTTGFVLDALNQAICQRAPSEVDKLIHHSDRGSQGCRSDTQSGSQRPASTPQLAVSATAMTTPWPKASSVCSKPRLSSSSAPGSPLVRSNGRR